MKVYSSKRKSSVWEDWLQFESGPFSGQKDSLKKLSPGPALDNRMAWLAQPESDTKWDTQAIHALLLSENEFVYPSPMPLAQKVHLQATKKRTTTYLITGQQPGLLGGPIYWLNKALTAIALAKKLSTPEAMVVPLFWVAGDDSDILECNRIELLEVFGQGYPTQLPNQDALSLIPVGERKLGRGCADVCEQLKELLKQVPAQWWEASLQESLTFSECFKKLVQKVLGPLGILLIDGGSREFKKLSNPILKEIAESGDEFNTCLQQVTDIIVKAGAKPQVSYPSNITHCFYLEKGERNRLVKEGDKWVSLKDPQQSLDLAELCAENRLTHDAVSRPIVIDRLFPVLGHVLGPSEMGYFTQLTKVFKHFTGHIPLVHHRLTTTFLSDAQYATLEKAEGWEAYLRHTPDSLKKSLQEESSGPVQAQIKELQGQLIDFLASQKKGQFALYSDYFTTFEHRILHEVSRLEKKLKKQDYAAKAHLYKPLFDILQWLGQGKGQDRHLNICSFINCFGEAGLETFVNQVDATSWEHLMIVMNPKFGVTDKG